MDLQWDQDQRRLINGLLGIFKDPKSSRLNQCAAAHYLGELHASIAVRALSEKITLNYVRTGFIDHMSDLGAAVEVALIQIGTPSIPAMIRNLEESDDARVRDLSLEVLYHIEGDKDIVRLRFQKAITAQKDSQKQARLEAALKSLGEMQFDK
jgi:HEAT repeat protein